MLTQFNSLLPNQSSFNGVKNSFRLVYFCLLVIVALNTIDLSTKTLNLPVDVVKNKQVLSLVPTGPCCLVPFQSFFCLAHSCLLPNNLLLQIHMGKKKNAENSEILIFAIYLVWKGHFFVEKGHVSAWPRIFIWPN